MVTTAKMDAVRATKHVVEAIPRKDMNDDETSVWKLEILEGRKLRRKEAEDRPDQNLDREDKQDEARVHPPADPGVATGQAMVSS